MSRVTGLRLGGWDQNIHDTVGNGLTGAAALVLEVDVPLLEHLGRRGLDRRAAVEQSRQRVLELLAVRDRDPYLFLDVAAFTFALSVMLPLLCGPRLVSVISLIDRLVIACGQ